MMQQRAIEDANKNYLDFELAISSQVYYNTWMAQRLLITGKVKQND